MGGAFGPAHGLLSRAPSLPGAARQRRHRPGIRLKKAAFLLLLAPGFLSADEVYLKGAGSLSGRIVEQTDKILKVDVGDGLISVSPSQVEKIVKGRSPLDEYDDRAAQIGPQDVRGWKNLGKWALDQGLSKQSRDAYKKVVAMAPNDAEARQALGFVQVDGQWVTEEEGYRAKGYIQYQGEWMTPAEAQLLQADLAADQARRDAEQRANEAEVAQLQAEQRAEEAEERAQEAEDRWRSSNPLYWGNWGYGVNYWPTTSYTVYP